MPYFADFKMDIIIYISGRAANAWLP